MALMAIQDEKYKYSLMVVHKGVILITIQVLVQSTTSSLNLWVVEVVPYLEGLKCMQWHVQNLSSLGKSMKY